MLESFFESWRLFQWTYLATLLLAVALAGLGVLVVSRGQVFIAAAISQASLLGIAASLSFGWGQPLVAATTASSVAALVTARRRSQAPGISGEEATGWLFLTCSSLAILILAHQPVGLKEVQATLASSVVGATAREAAGFAGLALVVSVGTWVCRRPLVLLILDPVMASAVGLRVVRWTTGIALLLGLSVGLAMQSAGLLFTFGVLVLPPLAAKNLSRELSPMFWLSPLIAAGGTAVGLVLSHVLDLPPGQTVVALLAVALLLAWAWRDFRDWMWG